MQLLSHDIRCKDNSETEPILSHPGLDGRSEVSSCSIEITSGVDASVADDDPSSPDIEDDDALVHEDLPQCRICFDIEGEDLIAPCHCKGTQKYVHRSCLDNWRSTKEGFAFAHCTECRAMFILRANVPPDRWWLRLKFQFLVARDHAFIFVIVQLIVAFLGVLVYNFYGEELREMFGYEEHPYGFYTMAVLAIVLVGLLYGFFIAIICGQRISERHYHVLAKQELTKIAGIFMGSLYPLIHKSPKSVWDQVKQDKSRFKQVVSKGFVCLLIFSLSRSKWTSFCFFQEYVVEDRESNKDVPDLDPSHVNELRMPGLF